MEVSYEYWKKHSGSEKTKKVTQEDLAAQLGVTATAVSKWENNYTLPDILMLCALADYFDVTTDDLLGRTAVVKEAVVVAESEKLAESIIQVVEEHRFRVVARFTAFHPALSYTLTHTNCKYIFTVGARDLISDLDIAPNHTGKGFEINKPIKQTNTDIIKAETKPWRTTFLAPLVFIAPIL